MPNFLKDNRGISFLELILVFMIVSLVTSMGFASYRTWQRQILLTNTRAEIESALVRAQQLATAAANNSAWGIRFATSSYTIFPGNFYNENDPDNITVNLEGVEIINSYITFSDGAGGYGSDVVFSKFDGETFNTGTVSMMVVAEPSMTKSITVNSPGQID